MYNEKYYDGLTRNYSGGKKEPYQVPVKTIEEYKSEILSLNKQIENIELKIKKLIQNKK